MWINMCFLKAISNVDTGIVDVTVTSNDVSLGFT